MLVSCDKPNKWVLLSSVLSFSGVKKDKSSLYRERDPHSLVSDIQPPHICCPSMCLISNTILSDGPRRDTISWHLISLSLEAYPALSPICTSIFRIRFLSLFYPCKSMNLFSLRDCPPEVCNVHIQWRNPKTEQAPMVFLNLNFSLPLRQKKRKLTQRLTFHVVERSRIISRLINY